MCIRHGHQRGGAENHVPNHSCPHYATGGKLCIFVGPRAWVLKAMFACPKSTGASWTVNAARPEATLFTSFFGQDFQIITHFLSPDTNPNEFAPNPLPFGSATWQSSFDSSKVWAQVCVRIRSPPAPTRVARMPARLPASYCSQLVRNRGQRAVKS